MDLREATEKRRHRREAVVKLAFARKDDEAVGGLLQDVSPTGARITLLSHDTGPGGHGFRPGDDVTVVIDEIVDELEGRVTRVSGDQVAVAFDQLNAETEAALVRGIAEAASKLAD